MELEKDMLLRDVEKYCALIKRYHETDVSKDAEFQRSFNGYYRMRQSKADFYQCFYAFLEQQKGNKTLTFHEVLFYLYEHTGIITLSFSSKLLATVRPEMPVWDRFVLKNLNLKAPYYNDKNRLEKTEQVYQKICEWYRTEEAAETLKLFERMLPDVPVSEVKKIDFILWKRR